MSQKSVRLQHVEFFHKEHFTKNYFRAAPPPSLEHFIDFFWETKFEGLWKDYPKGFSDTLFPNIGYTYLINLGTPFTMQVREKKFEMKTDGFLPRHHAIECFHRPGNKIFGIKFKVSPVIFEKNINFSEYREYIFPLSYLLDESIISRIKKANSFESRVKVSTGHFDGIIKKHPGSPAPIKVVTAIMDQCARNNNFTTSIGEFAREYKITARTLQRYFEKTTSISSKQALQILRIRKAVFHLAHSPQSFRADIYGYYDHSHFYKHLKSFFEKRTLAKLNLHLNLLQHLHKRALALAG